MRTSKMGSCCSEQKDEVIRVNSSGLLTRKPDKKAAFARKKAIQNMHPQSKYAPFTNRVSRQKRSPRTETIPHPTSLKIINSPIQSDIKYLSPKHSQSTLFISHDDKTTLKAPELSYSRNLFFNSSLQSTLDEMVTSDCMQNPSGISIQGLGGKSYALEGGELSGRDWFGLQAQNDRLKQENNQLHLEVAKLKEEIQSCKPKPFNKVYNSKVQSPKCKNCQTIKTQKKQIQCNFQLSKKEVQQLKNRIKALKAQLKQQQQTITLLSNELKSSRQSQDQLQSLVNSFKQKIQTDNSQLRYLNIQQDLLMRKKDELQKMKLENIKKDTERNNMKKMLAEYKDKIEILRKVITNNKKGKRQELQIQLQLSIDSSVHK